MKESKNSIQDLNNEIQIESLSEFLNQISILNKKSKDYLSPSVSSMTYYRGQSNFEWSLSPKLYRDGLFDQESVLISELRRTSSNSFNGLNYFDSLVKMQHYGLPTRLLDMTLNPLVALYFACIGDEQKNKDGIVYIFQNLPVFRSSESPIKIIMKYIFEYSGIGLDIKKFTEDVLTQSNLSSVHHKKHENESDLMHTLSKVPFYAVIPPNNNERIIKQDGAFFVFGMEINRTKISKNPGTHGKKYINFKPYSFKTVDEIHNNTHLIRVPSKSKKLIVDELALIGISIDKLFPELEYKTEFVTQLVKRKKFS